jgi:hypothetical protein
MQVRRMYRIREVDGNNDDISDTLGELHQLTFLDAAPVPKFDRGYWWLAFCGPEPVAFAASFRLPTSPMPAIFAALVCWASIADIGFSCA